MILFSHLPYFGRNHPNKVSLFSREVGNDASDSTDSLCRSTFIPKLQRSRSPCLRVRCLMGWTLMETSIKAPANCKSFSGRFQDPGKGEQIWTFQQMKHRSPRGHVLNPWPSGCLVSHLCTHLPSHLCDCLLFFITLFPLDPWEMIFEELKPYKSLMIHGFASHY